jgi:hypothetical protein
MIIAGVRQALFLSKRIPAETAIEGSIPKYPLFHGVWVSLGTLAHPLLNIKAIKAGRDCNPKAATAL